jgi:hypothetical protein
VNQLGSPGLLKQRRATTHDEIDRLDEGRRLRESEHHRQHHDGDIQHA